MRRQLVRILSQPVDAIAVAIRKPQLRQAPAVI